MCENLCNTFLMWVGLYNIIITRDDILTDSNALITGHYYQFFNRLRSKYYPQHKLAVVQRSDDEKYYVLIKNTYHACNVLMALDEFTSVLSEIIDYDFVLSGGIDSRYLTVHPVHLCNKNT